MECNQLSFRDIPWRWRDILIGAAPFLVLATATLLPRSQLPALTGWTSLAIAGAFQAWMLSYPLILKRHRPALSHLRRATSCVKMLP